MLLPRALPLCVASFASWRVDLPELHRVVVRVIFVSVCRKIKLHQKTHQCFAQAVEHEALPSVVYSDQFTSLGSFQFLGNCNCKLILSVVVEVK